MKDQTILVRESEVAEWVAIGWTDCGTYLPGWLLIAWPHDRTAVAPLSAVIATRQPRRLEVVA